MIVLSPTPRGTLYVFGGKSPDFPKEVFLYDRDPRGWVRGVKPVKTLSQALEAINSWPEFTAFFTEGDVVKLTLGKVRLVRYEGGRFVERYIPN